MAALPFFIFNTCTLSLDPDGFAENCLALYNAKDLQTYSFEVITYG
jgi:hypothetical protein